MDGIEGMEGRKGSRVIRRAIKQVKEGISFILYDKTALSASAAQKSLFTTPKGQSSKTTKDTNLVVSGGLQKGQKFKIEALGFVVSENSGPISITHLIPFLKGAFFEFNINGKLMLQLQGFAFPLLNTVASMTDGTNPVQMKKMDFGRYVLPEPILIDDGDNFEGILDYQAVTGLTSHECTVILYGQLQRQAA